MLATCVAVVVIGRCFVAAVAFAIVKKKCPHFCFSSPPVYLIFVAYCSAGVPAEFGALPFVKSVVVPSN